MGFPFLQTNQDQAKVQSKLKIMWYLAFMNSIFKGIMIIIIIVIIMIIVMMTIIKMITIIILFNNNVFGFDE